MKKRIERVVVVGHGYLPYLSAIYIQKKLGKLSPMITVVDLGATRGEPLICSLSSMRHFHSELGFAEVDFVKKTKAEINLGFDYTGFSESSGGIFADAQYGFSLNNLRFNHLFQKLKASYNDEKIEDYCLSAKLARIGHFTPPSPNPKSVYSTINYGYRLTGQAYSGYLKRQVEAIGIQIKSAQVESMVFNGSGSIEKVSLDDGSCVEADLFIDASESGVVRNQLMDSIWEEPAEPLYNTTSEFSVAVSHRVELSAKPSSVSKIVADEGGLTIEGGYQGRNYSTSISLNAPNIETESLALSCQKAWYKNCISIGHGVFNRVSLLIDNSHLHQNTLAHIIELWPRSESLGVEACRFNAKIAQDYRQVKDIDDLHLAVAFTKEGLLSRRAAYKLELFRETGKVAYYESELLQEQQWPVLFYALGVEPSRSDISVAGCDQRWLEHELVKIKTTLAKAASAAPRYQDFIDSVHR